MSPLIFSVEGIIPTTFIFGFNMDTARITPRTTPEPHISYFISSILAAGLIEIPPLSKVNPLPTSIFGFSVFIPLKYSITINFGGSSVPEATPAKAPIPISVNSFLSKTVTFTSESLDISFAFSAKCVGVAILPGRFSRSRAKHTELAMTAPF